MQRKLRKEQEAKILTVQAKGFLSIERIEAVHINALQLE